MALFGQQQYYYNAAHAAGVGVIVVVDSRAGIKTAAIIKICCCVVTLFKKYGDWCATTFDLTLFDIWYISHPPMNSLWI